MEAKYMKEIVIAKGRLGTITLADVSVCSQSFALRIDNGCEIRIVKEVDEIEKETYC